MTNGISKQVIQKSGSWWSSNLTEYITDPVSPSIWQQWLLKWAIPTLENWILMLWVIWTLIHRKNSIFIKANTSFWIKSTLLK